MEYKKYKIEEIGTVVGGGTPSTKNPNYYGGNIVGKEDKEGYLLSAGWMNECPLNEKSKKTSLMRSCLAETSWRRGKKAYSII